jgi:hypothetical protein
MPGMPPRPQQPMQGAPQAPQAGAPQNPYGIDPAVLEAMLGTYGDQLELGGLEEQMARAEALRGTATPEGRDSGRVYTAANPLEHLGTGIQRYRAGKRMQDLEGKQGEVRARIGENVKTYGKKYPGV